MAMGKRKSERQESLWVETSALAKAASHPFYARLNQVLDQYGFDGFVQKLCRKYYAAVMGRPSIPPAVYFRMLLIGYFEGIDSERGIAWRAADSMAIRSFLGYDLTEATPDHSSLSRTRRMLDLETHDEVFAWILTVLAKEGLLKGKTIGVDATTLEANAAMRSIVRKDTGEKYEEFLARLAKESGIETPTRAELIKFDKKRKKKMSNKEWEHPHNPDAKIGKMKDGRTRMLHKSEHAVDMETQAVVAVTLPGGDAGDTQSAPGTLIETQLNLEKVCEDKKAEKKLHREPLAEVVTDKGYHSGEALMNLERGGIRSYISEPDYGRRKWQGKERERDAVYANRRRIRGKRGKALMRKRGEFLERSFAHCYNTGGMRRVHLRGWENILKRLLIHVGGFNLGLVMRKLVGRGTPRGLAAGLRALLAGFYLTVYRFGGLFLHPCRARSIFRPESSADALLCQAA